MTATIPAELSTLFPDAKSIDFEDIRAGDTVASYERGRLIVGIASKNARLGYASSLGAWESSDGFPVAHSDEACLLLHRPKKPLPAEPGSLIRINKALPDTVEECLLFARRPTGSGIVSKLWFPVGFYAMGYGDDTFDDVEWTEVFITEENPSEQA